MLINDIVEYAARKHPGRAALRFKDRTSPLPSCGTESGESPTRC